MERWCIVNSESPIGQAMQLLINVFHNDPLPSPSLGGIDSRGPIGVKLPPSSVCYYTAGLWWTNFDHTNRGCQHQFIKYYRLIILLSAVNSVTIIIITWAYAITFQLLPPYLHLPQWILSILLLWLPLCPLDFIIVVVCCNCIIVFCNNNNYYFPSIHGVSDGMTIALCFSLCLASYSSPIFM